MKTLLLFSCFVVACLGQNQKLLGADQCTWGPSYWCSHIRHAKECGTMNSCMTKVWPKQTSDVKTEPDCTFCEMAVKEARRMLENKATQKELESFLSKICSVIPLESVKQECEDLVVNNLPEIIELIESEVDAKVVCTVCGFCKKNGPKKMLFASEPTHQNIKSRNDTYCSDCKRFFNDVRDVIASNASEANIKTLFYSFCISLGPLENACKEVVDLFVPILIADLRQELDPDIICSMIGFCTSNTHVENGLKMRLHFLSLTKKLTVNSNETCSICKEFAGELQVLIRNEEIQNAVKSFIEENVCARLSEFAKECNSLVEQYATFVFDFLATELDPDTLCVTLGLCKQPSIKTVKLPAGMVPLLPSKKVGGDTTCILCEFILSEVDSILKQNATEAEIQQALDEVCTLLPSTISRVCESFIDKYGPMIVKLLVDKVKPDQVCKTLKFCEEKTMPVARVPLVPLLLGGAPMIIDGDNTKVKSDELCEGCKLLVQIAKEKLENNKTVEDIEKELKMLCGLLPVSDFQKQCDGFVDEYTKQILALIEKKFTPKEVCSEIGLCSGKNHLLGGEDCTFGPAYWCASMENAEKCGTVEHCKKHAWK